MLTDIMVLKIVGYHDFSITTLAFMFCFIVGQRIHLFIQFINLVKIVLVSGGKAN